MKFVLIIIFTMYSHNTQFGVIFGTTLYFCTNEQTRKKYEELGMKPFSYKTKIKTVIVKRYYTLPEEILNDEEKLIDWVEDAVESKK